MKKTLMLSAATAAVVLMLGSATGIAQELSSCGTGALTGAAWTTQTQTVGTTSTLCFHGGSGNVVACDDPGNHVQVDTTAGSRQIRVHSNPDQNCFIAGSEEPGGCEISRTGGTGSTDFGYCGG
jgi:hypothetical protein